MEIEYANEPKDIKELQILKIAILKNFLFKFKIALTKVNFL